MKYCSLSVLLFILGMTTASAERWEYFVPGNYISDIAFQGDYVWCATTQSLVRWDRRDGTYSQYDERHYGAGSKPQLIEADTRGNLWIGAQGGRNVIFFDGKSWTALDKSHFPVSMGGFYADSHGNVWFTTQGDGVVRFDGTAWRQYSPNDSLRNVAGVVEDAEGALWFAASNGAWKWDGKTWRQYTVSEGLADDRVSCVVIDRTGVKWFGTLKGVSRVDGSSWRTFTMKDGLPYDQVISAAVDSTGNVWFGTELGAARWDGSQMKYFLKGSIDKLLESRVTDVTVDSEGNLWFCHGRRGLTVFDGLSWQHITPQNASLPERALMSAACDSRGVLWFVLENGNAASFDGAEWEIYGSKTFMYRANRVLADTAGRIWFVDIYNGIVCFDGNSWNRYTDRNGLRSDRVSTIGEGKDGALYVYTERGLSRFAGGEWQYITDSGGPIAWNINSVTEDSQGLVWFGTDWGLTRFDGVSWKTWRVADGLPENNIQAIAAAPDGSVWCTTAGKLCRFDGNAFTVYPGPVSGNPSVALDLLGPMAIDAEGIIWVCAGGRTWTAGNTFFREGLWRFHDGTWEAFLSGFGQPKLVRGVYSDDRGTIWYITTLGLASWDGKERRLFRVNAPDHVGATQIVTDHNDAVWVTSADGSAVHYVSRFDGTDWKVFAPGITPEIFSWSIQVDSQNRKWFSHARYLDGDSLRYALPPADIPGYGWNGFEVEGDGSTLWFGSAGQGLYRWDNGIMTNYTTTDGLLSNAIVPLAVDSDGTLWCSSGEDPIRPTGGHGIAWSDGNAWREHTIRGGASTVAFGKHGEAWFGTMDGVLRFDGKQWTEFTDLAGLRRPYIPSLEVDNEGNLWAATISGALRYDGKEWRRYTTADGLLSNNVSAIGVDSRNRKWFATGNGYCILDDSSPTVVQDAAPVPFALRGNHPNPFNPSTTISFNLPVSGKVGLTVYDITGRKVCTLVSGQMSAGMHSVIWDGRDDFGAPVSSGVYLYRLQCGKLVAVGRMALVK